MSGSFRSAREEVVYLLARDGWALSSIRQVMRAAGVLQRCGQIECSVDVRPAVRGELLTAAERARAIIERTVPKGWKVDTSGDPRGCVVHLYRPGENPETATGIGVPAQGYTSGQLKRFRSAGA